MATPQPIAVPGIYTLAAGPDNVYTNLPPVAYLYNIAWVTDRPGTAGYMVSDGVNWTADVGPQGLQGAPGAPGVNGNTILSGTGVPASGLGSNGDFYVDVVATRMYGPKTSGVWGSGVPLVGSAGSPGAAATISVGTVTTLSPGASATVSNAGTSSVAVLNFGIPVGATGIAGTNGTTGPAGLGTVTPSTPSRVIGTAFQPSATKATYVSYSARTQVTNPLLVGTSSAVLTLLSDASNPPTTERCRVSAESGVGITVTLALTTSNTAPLSYIVPPGHYVRIVSAVTGTGATSIISQTEEALG